ncbi:MAG: tetratricopeptide repeat protein [Bacteroidetes bacterium]|nr:tetratricopeptide repeat protein [Bacteroidota bacterium]MCH8523492.1 tetratricopeptide repeat protein [Balneolales bacterium]
MLTLRTISKLFTYSLALSIALLTLSCGAAGPDRDRAVDQIDRLEATVQVLMNEEGRSQASLEQTALLRDAYVNFADSFPGDSLSAVFLFQAAMVDADLHDDVRSGIGYLERLADEYPNHPLTSKTLFLIGFTYAEQLNDYNKARNAYNRYLDKYPDGEMAESVRIELENLGMRPRFD